MDFIAPEIMDYAEAHSENEPELLKELRRETWQKIVNPRMLSGVYQGRLLALLSKIITPNNILEIGTYTGYSTLCLAEGLQSGGMIHTIDCNEELQDIQQKYFHKSGQSYKIKQYLGNAINIIPELQCQFELVFIDADKSNYLNYFELVLPKLKKGGIIITDNVLWSGKVLNNQDKNDADTLIIDTFNKKIKQDSRFNVLLIPIRDGISLAQKK